MNTKYLFLLLISSLIACNTSQRTYEYGGASLPPPPISSTDVPPPARPGTCNAKCIIPSPFDMKTDTVLVLAADEPVPEEYMSYEAALYMEKKWVKKKSTNCTSSNPDDCLIWCLTSEPTKVAQVYSKIITNSDGDSDQKIVVQEHLDHEAKEVTTEWREVLCQTQIGKYQADITMALTGLGYEIVPDNQNSFKKALLTYQLSNRLPLGNLDTETVRSLGIEL